MRARFPVRNTSNNAVLADVACACDYAVDRRDNNRRSEINAAARLITTRRSAGHRDVIGSIFLGRRYVTTTATTRESRAPSDGGGRPSGRRHQGVDERRGRRQRRGNEGKARDGPKSASGAVGSRSISRDSDDVLFFFSPATRSTPFPPRGTPFERARDDLDAPRFSFFRAAAPPVPRPLVGRRVPRAILMGGRSLSSRPRGRPNGRRGDV